MYILWWAWKPFSSVTLTICISKQGKKKQKLIYVYCTCTQQPNHTYVISKIQCALKGRALTSVRSKESESSREPRAVYFSRLCPVLPRICPWDTLNLHGLLVAPRCSKPFLGGVLVLWKFFKTRIIIDMLVLLQIDLVSNSLIIIFFYCYLQVWIAGPINDFPIFLGPAGTFLILEHACQLHSQHCQRAAFVDLRLHIVEEYWHQSPHVFLHRIHIGKYSREISYTINTTEITNSKKKSVSDYAVPFLLT